MGENSVVGGTGFEIELNSTTTLIDPWLSGNPKAVMKGSDLES